MIIIWCTSTPLVPMCLSSALVNGLLRPPPSSETLFGCVALSPHVAPLTRVPLLLAAGAMMFASMVLDCWDGMQARRTGRTSKLGELLDHWLDAIHVPLVSAGMALMLELPPYRLPTARGVWRQMWERTAGFLRKAWTIILATSVGVWLLLAIPVGGHGRFADTPVATSAFAAVSGVVAPVFAPLGFGSWETSVDGALHRS